MAKHVDGIEAEAWGDVPPLKTISVTLTGAPVTFNGVEAERDNLREMFEIASVFDETHRVTLYAEDFERMQSRIVELEQAEADARVLAKTNYSQGHRAWCNSERGAGEKCNCNYAIAEKYLDGAK